MFKKSENLLSNFKKFYQIKSKDKKMEIQEQDFHYENNSKNLQSFYSDLSKNQKIQKCRKCGFKIDQNPEFFKICERCSGFLCENCVKDSCCFKCDKVFCISCIEDIVYDGRYYRICFGCKV